MGFIYKITNKINGKSYIGKTQKSVEERFKEHISEMNKIRVAKRPLYAAMHKYGVENFQIELVEEVDNSVLGDRETYWIEHFGTYGDQYNATRGGDGKPFYSHEAIFDELLFCRNVQDVARRVGCCTDTVSAVAKDHGIKLYTMADKARDELSRMVVCENDDSAYVFKSAHAASRWLCDNGVASSKPETVRKHIQHCAVGSRK
jgi:group I intron endonuclease